MTPKEKAEELVKIYISTCQRWNIEYVNSKNIKELKKDLFQLEWFIPKNCLLIAVNEIIKETKLHDKTIYQHGRTAYWQEVKQEIEKI